MGRSLPLPSTPAKFAEGQRVKALDSHYRNRLGTIITPPIWSPSNLWWAYKVLLDGIEGEALKEASKETSDTPLKSSITLPFVESELEATGEMEG